jgi:hypothetical protein
LNGDLEQIAKIFFPAGNQASGVHREAGFEARFLRCHQSCDSAETVAAHDQFVHVELDSFWEAELRLEELRIILELLDKLKDVTRSRSNHLFENAHITTQSSSEVRFNRLTL